MKECVQDALLAYLEQHHVEYTFMKQYGIIHIPNMMMIDIKELADGIKRRWDFEAL